MNRNRPSALLERWRAFMETNPEAVAERLDLLDRVESSGWATSYEELVTASRGLLETRGTPNEEHWTKRVIQWALAAAELERTRGDMIEGRIRAELLKVKKSAGEVIAGIYAERGGPPNDCDPQRVRLAVFSRYDCGPFGDRMGVRDMTAPEAREVASALIACAAEIEGAS